jgi:hypothetical protein
MEGTGKDECSGGMKIGTCTHCLKTLAAQLRLPPLHPSLNPLAVRPASLQLPLHLPGLARAHRHTAGPRWVACLCLPECCLSIQTAAMSAMPAHPSSSAGHEMCPTVPPPACQRSFQRSERVRPHELRLELRDRGGVRARPSLSVTPAPHPPLALSHAFCLHPAPPPHTGILTNIDHDGVTVLEALEQAGFDPSPASLRKMTIPKDRVGSRFSVLVVCVNVCVGGGGGMRVRVVCQTCLCFWGRGDGGLFSVSLSPLPLSPLRCHPFPHTDQGVPGGAHRAGAGAAGGGAPPRHRGRHRRPVAPAGRDCGGAGVCVCVGGGGGACLQLPPWSVSFSRAGAAASPDGSRLGSQAPQQRPGLLAAVAVQDF